MQISERHYFNFVNSIKSPESRRTYERHLSRFLHKNRLRVNQFLALPIVDIENMLIDHIVEMKNDKLSTSYISLSLSAIKHLCIMNDIRINKEKIGNS